MSRFKAVVAHAPLVCAVSLGCGVDGDGARGRPPASATLTTAYCCDSQAFSPAMDVDAKFLVFLPLMSGVQLDEQEGILAERWDVTDDHRTFTFHLRPGLTWHDGAPVSAHDVAFTIELLRHPDVLMVSPAGVLPAVVMDDSTVVIRHAEPTDPVQFWSWYVIWPKHLLEDLDPAALYDWAFWRAPVGNGPYRFVRHMPGVMTELQADEDFRLWRPRIPRVVLKFSQSAGLTELLAGAVDVVEIRPEQALRLEGDDRFRVYHSYHGYMATALHWRNDHPLFEDPRVRRALTMAVDRHWVIRALNLPEATPVFDGVYTHRQVLAGHLPPALPFDTGAAAALLEEVGWKDADGDGVLDRAGMPFRFTALVAGADLQGAGLLVQDQFRRVGIHMMLEVQEPNVTRDRVRLGAFDAYLGGFGNAPGGLHFALGDESRIRYRNAAVAALVREARTEPDPDRRDRLYGCISHHLHDDPPALWLFPQVGMRAAHRRVRGLRSPDRVAEILSLRHLWLEDDTAAVTDPEAGSTS
ncbi:MAG: ABC transporter substrate-binding protein [Gemmatimonadota bacterium]